MKGFNFEKNNRMKQYIPEQLTFDLYGHTLHHCQVISPDNQWIVYDTRNEDTAIGTTTRIERVNVDTKEIQVLYETKNANEYGPGVGAVTYSPTEEKVLFIHGIDNATADKPYEMARRTGVAIHTNIPNHPINMDARDVEFPYTKGALRGGTHSHCWHPNSKLISFTYNDEVLAENHIPNERAVGVMFPKQVLVPNSEKDDQISGEMFSVILTQLVEKAKAGSDEIEKAFDECWLGDKRSLVFQGWVRDENGNRKTEIFLAELPNDLTLLDNVPLEGTKTQYPGVPKGVIIKRVSCTPKGVSSLRHWLRSSPDGDYVYFLMENEENITNIYRINMSNSEINQVTNHQTPIQSPFNISPFGDQLIYFCNHQLILFDINTSQSIPLIEKNDLLYGIPNFDKTGQQILFNQYVADKTTSKFLQIFKIQL